MDAVLDDLVSVVAAPLEEVRRVNCHHNYTAREHHHGKDLWVTRKGAIRARRGDWGVVPGSMGTNTFIVKGLGNPASYDSAAHGAGRTMSRTQAKKTLTVESLADAMDGKAWLADKARALLDEHPDSYKDIERVMADQADLVEIEVELHQILNYKGA
jgi:tRNA-splicing ligase RtcB